MSLPQTLPKAFVITTPEGFVFSVTDNIHRHVSIPIKGAASAVTFRLLETTGNERIAIHAMELL